MNIHNTRIDHNPETLYALVTGNRMILRSLCLLLSQETMDWRLVLQIDETLPHFIKNTDAIKRTIFNATCEFNNKRRWILQKGCYPSYLTAHMLKNFILIDYTYWISVHKNKKERQEAIRELVYTLGPKTQQTSKTKIVPQFAWTPQELAMNFDTRFSNDNR